MNLKQKYTLSECNEIKALYEIAFPPEEKKPFSLILQKSDEGHMQIFAIEENDGRFLGLAIFILHGDLALLDYLAIVPTERGRGIGSLALSLLKRHFTGKRFLLEIEDVDEPNADNKPDRIRRRNFYLRNRMFEMPYRIRLFGVQMRVLTGGAPVSFAEYHALFPAVFGEKAASHIQLIEEL